MHWILSSSSLDLHSNDFLLNATDDLPGWLPGPEEFLQAADGMFWVSSSIHDSGLTVVAVSWGLLQHLTLFLQIRYGNKWPFLGMCFLPLFCHWRWGPWSVHSLYISANWSHIHLPNMACKTKRQSKRLSVPGTSLRDLTTAVLRCGFRGN